LFKPGKNATADLTIREGLDPVHMMPEKSCALPAVPMTTVHFIAINKTLRVIDKNANGMLQQAQGHLPDARHTLFQQLAVHQVKEDSLMVLV